MSRAVKILVGVESVLIADVERGVPETLHAAFRLPRSAWDQAVAATLLLSAGQTQLFYAPMAPPEELPL